MALNARLKQFAKIALSMASMVAGQPSLPQNQVSQIATDAQVQKALPENYSDLLIGENAENLQPYLDLLRETKTGRELLDSMRRSDVHFIYLDPFITDTGGLYTGMYVPEDNTVRIGAQGNPPEILWSLYHEVSHSRTHNKLKKMGYAHLPTSTLDDAYVANAIDEALAERTAAQGFLEVIEKHPEIKDQKTDYYEKLIKEFKDKHPELADYKIREDFGQTGLKMVREWLKQGYKGAEIVQGIYEERLLGYEDSLPDYEGQAFRFYTSGKNNGIKLEVNPDWNQYVSKLTDGQVTEVPLLPECTVWGLHDRLSSEFSRLGNDITKIRQMDLSCPISQSYRDAFVREGIKIYAGISFEALYNKVPSVQQDILKLTGCNPCETYKNGAGMDIPYFDTDVFKRTSAAFSPKEYMEQACKIYMNPDVQKFLDKTTPATKSDIMAIMTMKEVLFTPDEKIPNHICPIKQMYEGKTENQQQTENRYVFQQESLKHLTDTRS